MWIPPSPEKGVPSDYNNDTGTAREKEAWTGPRPSRNVEVLGMIVFPVGQPSS